MTLASYLGQLKRADLRFKQLMERAEEWHNIATSTGLNIDGDKDRVQTSKCYDKMEKAILEATECERLALEEYSDLVNLKKTIEKQLSDMSNSEYGLILEYYYIKDLTLGEICGILGYTERNLKRIKKRAIIEFETKYEKCYK
jgi:DNA-directed RNA polymerase specialized sigma subunit